MRSLEPGIGCHASRLDGDVMIVFLRHERCLHVTVESIRVVVLHADRDRRTDAAQPAAASDDNADNLANVFERIEAIIAGLALVVHATFAAPTLVTTLGTASA